MSNRAELWTPGQDLAGEYPTPTNDELADLWSEYTGNSNALPVDGVYGAYTQPTRPVRAIASIDVCDVLRETAVAFDLAVGTLEPTRRHLYDKGTYLSDETLTKEYKDNIFVSVLRPLMDNGLVPPVEQSAEIADILHSWHGRGIYRAANTSTLAGCEPGTIKYNFGRDMPGCFDAVLFPRNYDGSSDVATKAGALAVLAEGMEVDLNVTPVVHIDDADHHIGSFERSRSIYPLLDMIIPVHASNTGKYTEYEAADPLAAFERADDYFKRQGV